jgi:hypothetical protein
MSRNGSGTYTLPAGNPVVTGTTISSTWANTTLTNIASALTDSLAADGQTTATGNLQMGNNRITGLANGIAATDAASLTQVTNAVAITGGTINGTSVGATTAATGRFTTLEATGVTTVQAGTAAAPAITTTGDTNTGVFFPAADTIAFSEGGVEAMRIDSSGSVGIGLTTSLGDANGMFIRTGTGDTFFNHITGTTSGSGYLQFIYATTLIGNITQNGTTAVAYNTTSDYRLKEDITPMTGALATVSTLKPVTYKWKIDGSDGQGFIAHELQAVMPDCVTGEKDAVDEDGNIKPQGIDTSFLVATLTAAIQELKATVDAQAERIAALEA